MAMPWIGRDLADLETAGLLRQLRVASAAGPTCVVDGRRAVVLCSNDYLGLATDPLQRELLTRALGDLGGAGAGASRLVSGNLAVHEAAETALAAFVGAGRALLFTSGYVANVSTLAALIGPDDAVLSDELNHASLIDGMRLARARIHVYRHRDADHARVLLRAARGRRRFIVTDALFSMDGDVAPLADLARLAQKHDAALVVDEAHSLGVLGPHGQGLCAATGVRPDVLVGTLGKAFGAAGAFVATDELAARWLLCRARGFVFSTAISPLLARLAADLVPIVQGADERRSRAHAHASRLRRELRLAGFRVPEGQGLVVPVMLGEPAAAMRLSSALLERGVFVQGIRPPTVPTGTSRLRVVPTAAHDETLIDEAIDAFRALAHLAP